ncbi:D-amino-acid oxidase [Colletotrichum gloeosporioides]|uniref:D-amino-acid oxidase n=1 Tax=Colletotrichum gloeosporioides TaxID=474922 RepID=A0A8H4CDG6_COLGL|nr:D-amino-acid oxidase [Colletotrichum gloeosporioides]KAF3801910.1 D-amino-acid oxidase [Colletotrichum gloeosporioides]
MISRNDDDPIVIIGAGVIGLDTALVLARRGLGRQTTVIAEHFPGDTSVNYTSPWAGANFSAISGSDTNALRWDRLGYSHLTQLATSAGRDSFVHRTPSIEYWDEAVSDDKIKSMSEYLEDFKVILANDLPDGVLFGVSFTTVTINAPKHIEYLFGLLKKEYGVQFILKKLPSIQSAFSSKTKVAFNCTGNAARFLPGVEDTKCYPTRGQIVLARAPQVTTNVMRHGHGYETYIIPRPWSNGNVILGGYMQKGVSTSDTFAHETDSILSRTSALSSELKESKPDVLASFSGLRPSREGGARVERTQIDVDGRKHVLVHNYGAGGTGFQAGYGMALDAVEAVDDILEQVMHSSTAARL